MTYNTNTGNISPIRTPYHELGKGAPMIPEWAQHRSVYRAAGRTLYLVETDALDVAREDLDTLSSRGWDVRIDRGTSNIAGENRVASIALSRKAA